jgi:high-affinity iron transporter
VPIEYDDGTEDDQVTIPFELQEAVAFVDGAQAAFDDLQPALAQRDAGAVATIERSFAELRAFAVDASERRRVVASERLDAAHARAAGALDAVLPEEWKQTSDEADFDLIEISLDQMQAAVSAGEHAQAEQARLTAYAFFEFGPEIKLRAFDPQLVAEVEGLVWYGARGVDGLAELIAARAGVRELHETRLVLDEALDDARATTGDGASGATVITNAALIVFREGLEAILIIAAITASMIGANRPLRRPVFRGALLALPASVALFAAAVLLLESLSRYGEKLEAVVGLVAIAVLMLVLNWFFHRVYWTQWIAGHRRRGKQLLGSAAGVTTATVAGLYLLGFSSVFREGFETVLFLQALQLSSGTGIVLAGVSLGLLATTAVGAMTFALERRLPYKRMLIVTGVLISLVLVVLVGNTVRTLQGVGWFPITPLELQLPLWTGTWLGVFPTVETLGAQAAALVFVLGSYFAAERLRHRRRRAAARGGRERARPPSLQGGPGSAGD